ncbi:MAG: DUF805 domain-containing protein [Campylobacter sp.]|nr:DUF805 domain-containing protein [Campylobacter sp.]
MMSFGEAISVCLKQKYATFSGRASRSEYWWFYLFTVLVSIVTSVIDNILGTNILIGTYPKGNPKLLGIISAIVSLILFIPTLAATFRRLHDRNKTGWFAGGAMIALILGIALKSALILLVGGLGLFVFVLVMLILPGDNGTNDYGADPLNPNSDNGNIFVS